MADAGNLPSFVSPGLCKVHGVCDYKQTEPGGFDFSNIYNCDCFFIKDILFRASVSLRI